MRSLGYLSIAIGVAAFPITFVPIFLIAARVPKWAQVLPFAGPWLIGWGIVLLVPASMRKWFIAYMLVATAVMPLMAVSMIQ